MDVALRAITAPQPYSGYVIIPEVAGERRLEFAVTQDGKTSLKGGFKDVNEARAYIDTLIAQAGASSALPGTRSPGAESGTVPGEVVQKAPMKTSTKVAIVGGGAAAALFAIMANR